MATMLEAHGFTVLEFGQGFRSFNYPGDSFEAFIHPGKPRHDECPDMR